MHQRGRLQGVIHPFSPQIVPGQIAELLIHNRQHFGERFDVGFSYLRRRWRVVRVGHLNDGSLSVLQSDLY